MVHGQTLMKLTAEVKEIPFPKKKWNKKSADVAGDRVVVLRLGRRELPSTRD